MLAARPSASASDVALRGLSRFGNPPCPSFVQKTRHPRVLCIFDIPRFQLCLNNKSSPVARLQCVDCAFRFNPHYPESPQYAEACNGMDGGGTLVAALSCASVRVCHGCICLCTAVRTLAVATFFIFIVSIKRHLLVIHKHRVYTT